MSCGGCGSDLYYGPSGCGSRNEFSIPIGGGCGGGRTLHVSRSGGCSGGISFEVDAGGCGGRVKASNEDIMSAFNNIRNENY